MKKLLTKAIKLTALAMTVLLMNFSCQDHEVQQILPVLQTLPVNQSREYQSSDPFGGYITHYKVMVTEKGNVPVTEYGVLYSTYRADEINADYAIKVPTVSNATNHVITEEFGVGEKRMDQRDITYPLRTYVYQRAYAKLSGERVVYGDVVLTVAGQIVTTPL